MEGKGTQSLMLFLMQFSPLWYRDERQLFADRSLYTADSENEEDKKPTKKANMKTESSGREGAESEGSPKPLNSMVFVLPLMWQWATHWCLNCCGIENICIYNTVGKSKVFLNRSSIIKVPNMSAK